MKTLFLASFLSLLPTLSFADQPPLPPGVQAVINALVDQRNQAQNQSAQTQGALAEAQAKITELQKQLDAVHPPKDTPK